MKNILVKRKDGRGGPMWIEESMFNSERHDMVEVEAPVSEPEPEPEEEDDEE